MCDVITSERSALVEASKIKGTHSGGGEACGRGARRGKFWVYFI